MPPPLYDNHLLLRLHGRRVAHAAAAAATDNNQSPVEKYKVLEHLKTPQFWCFFALAMAVNYAICAHFIPGGAKKEEDGDGGNTDEEDSGRGGGGVRFDAGTQMDLRHGGRDGEAPPPPYDEVTAAAAAAEGLSSSSSTRNNLNQRADEGGERSPPVPPLRYTLFLRLHIARLPVRILAMVAYIVLFACLLVETSWMVVTAYRFVRLMWWYMVAAVATDDDSAGNAVLEALLWILMALVCLLALAIVVALGCVAIALCLPGLLYALACMAEIGGYEKWRRLEKKRLEEEEAGGVSAAATVAAGDRVNEVERGGDRAGPKVEDGDDEGDEDEDVGEGYKLLK